LEALHRLDQDPPVGGQLLARVHLEHLPPDVLRGQALCYGVRGPLDAPLELQLHQRRYVGGFLQLDRGHLDPIEAGAGCLAALHQILVEVHKTIRVDVQANAVHVVL
jgi:hypothetical protein